MKLKLVRETFSSKSTIGRLYLDDQFECYTLEDVVREGPKIPGETAIPSGTYRVVNTFSQRFKKVMPLLVGVPGFEGIRIHPGNTDVDTHGCILVGRKRGTDQISESRLAYEALFAKLDEQTDVEITVEGSATTIRAACAKPA